MNDTPRTDAIAHHGYNESAYIAEMTGLSRQLERENKTFRAAQKACEDCDAPRVDRIAELERELEQERQDRKQADLDTIRALGERNDARAMVNSLRDLVTTDHESKESFIYRVAVTLNMPTPADIDAHLDECVAKSAASWKPLPEDSENDTQSELAAWELLSNARGELQQIKAAIRATLDKNRHLADGEDCTLAKLKAALPDWT